MIGKVEQDIDNDWDRKVGQDIDEVESEDGVEDEGKMKSGSEKGIDGGKEGFIYQTCSSSITTGSQVKALPKQGAANKIESPISVRIFNGNFLHP